MEINVNIQNSNTILCLETSKFNFMTIIIFFL